MVPEAGTQPTDHTSPAVLTGLNEDHTTSIGKTWHPFGQAEEHEAAVNELEDEQEDKGKQDGKAGALSGMMAGFKKLGDKMRGSKSHRFTDLLHLHSEVKRDLSDVSLYPELTKDAELR